MLINKNPKVEMSFAYELDGTKAIISEGSTEIPDYAFQDLGITEVVIPDTVTEIGNFAFYGNELESVVIPPSVAEIGSEAFRYNNITSVDIPESVASLGSYAFADNQIESVVIPDGMTSIPYGLFYQNQLTTIDIPDSVESIGGNSFCGNQLASVDIPENVSYIGTYAFSRNDLVSVEIPDSVATIDTRAFSGNELINIELGNSVTTIGNSAFYGNELTIVDIPRSVVSVGDRAFGENPELESITISESSALDLSAYEEMGIVIIFSEDVDNIISSTPGKALMEGTLYADQFTFNDFEAFGVNTADKIIGFDSSQGDSIAVGSEAFPSLVGDEEVSFASSSNGRELIRLFQQDLDFVYYQKFGVLFYNGNGSEKGLGNSFEGGVVAILEGKPELTVNDFTLLA